jgi:hypothetical protein
MSGQPTAEIQGQPLVVTRDQEKMRFVLQVRALIVELEGPTPLRDITPALIRILGEIHQASPIPETDFARLDLLFIEPYALPLHELVLKVKTTYFQPMELISSATDVGFSVDEQVGDTIRHRQIGPMEPAQLNEQYLNFKRDDLPRAFLFLSMGHSSSAVRPFSREGYREFLSQALQRQTEQAQQLARQMAG